MQILLRQGSDAEGGEQLKRSRNSFGELENDGGRDAQSKIEM